MDIDPIVATQDGQSLFDAAYSASQGDLKGMSAAGLALAKGLDDVGVHQVMNLAMSAVGGAAAGATIGSLIPGIGTVVGGAIGAIIGAIEGILSLGGASEGAQQDPRTHTAQKLVFPWDPSKSLGFTEGWVRPQGATPNTALAASRIADIGRVPDGRDNNWNWLSTFLGGDHEAAQAVSAFLHWYGWNHGPPYNLASMQWFASHGIDFPLPTTLAEAGPWKGLPGNCAYLPDCSQSVDRVWGTDYIYYPIAELAALQATPEEALHYVMAMTWLWKHGQRIDGLAQTYPPNWARVMGNLQANITPASHTPILGLTLGLTGALHAQTVLTTPPPRPPLVINPSALGDLSGIVRAQWVKHYLSLAPKKS
jgi:hypothetical protein